MNFWTVFVEALASVVVSVGDLVGGPGPGILLATFALRAVLIPVLGPLSVRTRARQRIVRRIRPQIKALDRELKDHPGTLHKRLKALHEEHGIGMVDWAGLAGALIQVPVLIALFQAVLLVWEADALTLAGLGLGLLAAGLSLVSTRASGQAEGQAWMLWLSGLLPLAICLWLGPGIGFYLCGFYGAALLQAAVMGRDETPEEPETPHADPVESS